MGIEIKQDDYFDLEVEVEESTVVLFQNDSDIVISKDAAEKLMNILQTFVERTKNKI